MRERALASQALVRKKCAWLGKPLRDGVVSAPREQQQLKLLLAVAAASLLGGQRPAWVSRRGRGRGQETASTAVQVAQPHPLMPTSVLQTAGRPGRKEARQAKSHAHRASVSGPGWRLATISQDLKLEMITLQVHGKSAPAPITSSLAGRAAQQAESGPSPPGRPLSRANLSVRAGTQV